MATYTAYDLVANTSVTVSSEAIFGIWEERAQWQFSEFKEADLPHKDGTMEHIECFYGKDGRLALVLRKIWGPKEGKDEKK